MKRVAHLAFDLGARHERGHRVDDDAVDAARADERLGDLERLLAGVRLADEQLVDVDAAGPRVARIERVLDVDEGDDPAARLGLGEDVLADGRLARRLRAEDLGDPAARDAADAERQVERDRAGRDGVEDELLARPELHDRAAPELLLDRGQRGVDRLAPLRGVAAPPLALRSSPSVRHAPHPIHWTARRSGRVASAGRSALLRVVLDDVRSLRGLRITSTFCGGSDIGDRLGWALFAFGFFLASLLGRSREPIASPPRRHAAYRSILHADFPATSPPLIRPARRRSSDIEAGKVPARIAARILAMKSRVKVRL